MRPLESPGAINNSRVLLDPTFTTAVMLLWWLVVGGVAVDAARRGRSWLGWALVAATTELAGLIVWLILRRRWPETGTPLGRRRTILLWLSGFVVSPAIVIVSMWTTTFVVQSTRVEGQAMAPTLADQDRVLVNRMAYRTAKPERGDVVTLLYPLNPEKTFIKRVIALGGDAVRIVDGTVFVNDQPLADPQVAAEFRSHEYWGPAVVPEGYCFVMGDRRNSSADSRHWGFVPRKYVTGRISYRFARPWLLAPVR